MTSESIMEFNSNVYLPPIQINILKKLIEKGFMTRDQLCEEFGFKKHKVVCVISQHKFLRKKEYRREFEQYDKRTTIYDNLMKLQKRKLIEQFSENNGKRGRPHTFWKIKESEETIQIINQIS